MFVDRGWPALPVPVTKSHDSGSRDPRSLRGKIRSGLSTDTEEDAASRRRSGSEPLRRVSAEGPGRR